MALEFKGPTVLGLNRHSVPLQVGTNRLKMQKGAYTILEDSDYKVTLVSTGGDLSRAVDASRMLKEAGIAARVVSMPCMRRFEQQDEAYQRSVFPWDGRPVVSYEAMSTHGWAKYATASIGHNSFGTTVDAKEVYGYFKLTEKDIFERVNVYLADLGNRNAHLVPWKNI
jgi:transketolase